MLLGQTDKHSRQEDSDSGVKGVPAAISDTGCERDLNEDRYAVVESNSGLAWIVCDGMGGATGGELAAQLAIDAIRRDLENFPSRPPEVALKASFLEANRVIVLRRQNQAFAQMGTTIVAALFQGPELVISHLGDSRAYLIRDGAIQQLTTDHTYVQELVDKGQIRIEEALSHPQAHILTRCIGAEPAIDVEMQKYWVWEVDDSEVRDFLLLCTDGLYSLVAEGEIANIVSQESPQNACVQLVQLAKNRGGYDNITFAIIPLQGQLRQEPVPGHSYIQKTYSKGDGKKDEKGRGLFKTILVAGVLSVLSAIIVVMLFIFSLSD